ncbi:hypothetical protein D5018_20370 [Parashewanella curva]|uniref:Uncharacterized protein n=1 Tax=Parashewanella curva TaxID=2338552 RepID=A0A3L8PSP9_9GAMM|nr:hypothetical protein [Parashewanella curva]RLV57849.1 hypothetical protein D5018_20370 [Parashewanella curva]
MRRQNYIDYCFAQLLELFEQAKLNRTNPELKARIEGLFQAGKVLNIYTDKEALELMEQAHHHVFGESMAERSEKKTALKQAIDRGDDDFIDIPAYERRNQ